MTIRNKKLIKLTIIGFFFGFLMMPIWAFLFRWIVDFDISEIAPSALWAKMIVGGLVGSILVPFVMWDTLPVKEK